MEECFTFQWGWGVGVGGEGGCFSDGGTSFLSVGRAPWGSIGFDGEGFQKKSVDVLPPPPFLLWETQIQFHCSQSD